MLIVRINRKRGYTIFPKTQVAIPPQPTMQRSTKTLQRPPHGPHLQHLRLCSLGIQLLHIMHMMMSFLALI